MTNFKKFISLALAGILLACTFVGCTPKNEDKKTEVKDFVLKIDDHAVSLEEFTYYYNMIKYYYAGDVEKLAEKEEYDNFLAEVTRELKLNESLEILAEQQKVSLTDDEYKTQVSDYLQQVKDSYGDSYEQELKNAGLTEEIFENQLRLSALYNKAFTETTKDGAIFDVSDVEAIKKAALDAGAIRAKHVLVQFGEAEYEQVPEDGEDMTEEQKEAAKEANKKAQEAAAQKDKAEKLAVAQEVLAKAKDGADFDELIKEYNDDPGMTTYPGGYYFVEGEMVTEFYEGALALEEGEISDIIETSYGYHIIQRLPYDDESIMASSFGMQQVQMLESEKFMAEVEKISEGLEIIYTEDFETKYSYEEMEKLTAVEEPEAQQ